MIKQLDKLENNFNDKVVLDGLTCVYFLFFCFIANQ